MYIRYGITTWGNASDTLINSLRVLNHRAARIMTFAPFGRIDISPLLNYLEILDIDDIFSLETSKLVFKLKKEMIALPLSSYFEVRNQNATHSYNLRHRNRTEQPIIHRTSYALKSLQYRTPFVWNNIPDHLKCCETLSSFKKQLKSHFLELFPFKLVW